MNATTPIVHLSLAQQIHDTCIRLLPIDERPIDEFGEELFWMDGLLGEAYEQRLERLFMSANSVRANDAFEDVCRILCFG